MGRLDGKVVAITGSGSGIGREGAILFAAEGARIAVMELRPEAGRDTVAVIERAGGSAIYCETNVSEPDSVEATINKIMQTYGKIDVMYNNAGGSSPKDGSVINTTIEEFWKAIKLDLFGTWLCCRFAVPHMIEAGGGVVINTVSNVALMGCSDISAYTASKGGVVSLTRAMAVDFAPSKIRVNAIMPSATKTQRLLDRMKTHVTVQKMAAAHLIGLAEPIDIARAALFLACDDSMFMTGHILAVDSGITIS